jgi:RNA polymerase sigma-70 factor (ECF subfamily)
MPLRVGNASATTEEIEFVAAIRAGDEKAFATLVERHYWAMLALAKAYVLAPDIARRVVDDAWMAALAGSDGFDGTTALRAWLLGFVVRSAGPLAAQPDGGGPDATRPAVDVERFRGSHDAFPGHWRAYPRDWRALPDDIRYGDDARRVVEIAVEALPIELRAVITLRDIARCPLGEACDVLELSEVAARERLHQARSAVRAALERHFDG